MAITVTIPSVGAYGGTIPDKSTQSPTVFSDNVYLFHLFYNGSWLTDVGAMASSLNTFKTEANALATQANTDASTATTQAGIATTQAANSLASADASEVSRLAAEAAFDAFDDRYLGSFATDPTLDNDGNALTTGALYYNTTSDSMLVYDVGLAAWGLMSFVPTSHLSLTNVGTNTHAQIDTALGILANTSGTNTGDQDLSALAPKASPVFTGTVQSGGQLQLSRGADVASATALPILTDGNSFNVTGVTTITSINTTGKVGTQITLTFTGILTLTHHATDLKLPSGANITTAVGDVIVLEEYATGDFKFISYTRADGTALVAATGGLTLIDKTVISGTPTAVDITIPIGYQNIEIVFSNIIPTTDGQALNVQLSSDGGTTWTTTTDYFYEYTSVGASNNSSTAGVSSGIIANNIGNATNEHGASGRLILHDYLSTTKNKYITFSGGYSSNVADTVESVVGIITKRNTSAVDTIRFSFLTSFASGTISTYGVE